MKYKLVKDKKIKKNAEINLGESLDIKKHSKNGNLNIHFYNKKLSSIMSEKIINKAFKKILAIVLENEENDGDPSEGLMMCLNEMDKFKKYEVNKYHRFLLKEKEELLLKKIELIEKEMQAKLAAIRLIQSQLFRKYPVEYEEEEEKTSNRHR